jgi:hypothetical protein
MQKPILLTLYVASLGCAVLMVLWLIRLSGATYSYSAQTEDGSSVMICNAPIFTADNWLWTFFEIIVVPVLILIAAIQTIRVLHKRLF